MKLPVESKFKRWKYVEIAQYIPSLDKVARVQTGAKGNKTPVLVEWEGISDYIRDHGDVGVYSSVFHYDNVDLDKATRLGNLYFDLDDKEHVSVALEDAKVLTRYLLEHISPEAVRVYFTGLKGFHLEAEAIALGIGPSNSLPELFRYIANSLKDELNLTAIDFQVYDLRRMWRVPDTKHQKTGLYKVEVPKEMLFESDLGAIMEWASEPRYVEVPPQKFDGKANEWYREWQYKKEEKKFSTDEMIERFQRFGSGTVRKMDDSEREFNPRGLFDGCPSILRLWKKAEETHDLDHEERLFLCSLLTYNEEAQWYLHAILSQCDDYDKVKSQSHIDDWIRRRELSIGGRPYSCRRANEVGVGCGNCELESKEKWEQVGDKMVKTGEVAEASPIRFAYRRKK